MNRIYHHYKKWEDWKNGLYALSSIDESKMISNSISILSDKKRFFDIAMMVLDKWPFSCQHNLTNKFKNRKAWLGQASCCFEYNVPEYLTKIAWNMMSKQSQDDANNVARKIIEIFERRTKYENERLPVLQGKTGKAG